MPKWEPFTSLLPLCVQMFKLPLSEAVMLDAGWDYMDAAESCIILKVSKAFHQDGDDIVNQLTRSFVKRALSWTSTFSYTGGSMLRRSGQHRPVKLHGVLHTPSDIQVSNCMTALGRFAPDTCSSPDPYSHMHTAGVDCG